MKQIRYFITISLIIISLSACKEKKDEKKEDNVKTENKKVENPNSNDGKFFSAEYAFKIMFPGKPDVEKEQEVSKGLYIQTFMYDDGNSGNMVVAGRMDELYTDLFEGNEEKLAISIRDATLDNLSAVLTKEEKIEIKGQQANYYEAKGNFDGEDFYIKGSNIIRDKYIYIVICFSKSVDVKTSDYNEFVNSIEFL